MEFRHHTWISTETGQLLVLADRTRCAVYLFGETERDVRRWLGGATVGWESKAVNGADGPTLRVEYFVTPDPGLIEQLSDDSAKRLRAGIAASYAYETEKHAEYVAAATE